MQYLFEDHALDPERRELRRGETVVAVEPQVFDLLTYLLRHRERVISQGELVAEVWQGRNISDSSFRARINAARAAIGDNGQDQRLIRTLPRKGFRFVGSVQEDKEAVPAVVAPVLEATPSGMLPTSITLAPEAIAAERMVAATASRPFRVTSTPTLAIRGRRIAMMLAAGALLSAFGVVALYRAWPVGNLLSNPSLPSSAPQFNASIVPLIPNDERRSLATYADRGDFKAIAIGPLRVGLAESAATVEIAKEQALSRCRSQTRRLCKLYAVGMEVVWSPELLPLPDSRDVRADPLDMMMEVADVPLIRQGNRNSLRTNHTNAPNHRAVAVAKDNLAYVTQRESRAEAARLAVEMCGEFSQQRCLLLSVDGFLTIQIPKSRNIVDVFLPSTHEGITDQDRQRIAQVYRGREWRALARGRNGSWHPVAGASSETAAVERALANCAQVDQECVLYAIGNFRVE